jgi:hypothetical protein
VKLLVTKGKKREEKGTDDLRKTSGGSRRKVDCQVRALCHRQNTRVGIVLNTAAEWTDSQPKMWGNKVGK